MTQNKDEQVAREIAEKICEQAFWAGCKATPKNMQVFVELTAQALQEKEKSARAEERAKTIEECAKIVDESVWIKIAKQDIAQAIRYLKK